MNISIAAKYLYNEKVLNTNYLTYRINKNLVMLLTLYIFDKSMTINCLLFFFNYSSSHNCWLLTQIGPARLGTGDQSEQGAEPPITKWIYARKTRKIKSIECMTLLLRRTCFTRVCIGFIGSAADWLDNAWWHFAAMDSTRNRIVSPHPVHRGRQPKLGSFFARAQLYIII